VPGLGVAVGFDTVVLLVIVLSSSAMALESCTLDRTSALAATLMRVDLASTAIFTFD